MPTKKHTRTRTKCMAFFLSRLISKKHHSDYSYRFPLRSRSFHEDDDDDFMRLFVFGGTHIASRIRPAHLTERKATNNQRTVGTRWHNQLHDLVNSFAHTTSVRPLRRDELRCTRSSPCEKSPCDNHKPPPPEHNLHAAQR